MASEGNHELNASLIAIPPGIYEQVSSRELEWPLARALTERSPEIPLEQLPGCLDGPPQSSDLPDKIYHEQGAKGHELQPAKCQSFAESELVRTFIEDDIGRHFPSRPVLQLLYECDKDFVRHLTIVVPSVLSVTLSVNTAGGLLSLSYLPSALRPPILGQPGYQSERSWQFLSKFEYSVQSASCGSNCSVNNFVLSLEGDFQGVAANVRHKYQQQKEEKKRPEPSKGNPSFLNDYGYCWHLKAGEIQPGQFGIGRERASLLEDINRDNFDLVQQTGTGLDASSLLAHTGSWLESVPNARYRDTEKDSLDQSRTSSLISFAATPEKGTDRQSILTEIKRESMCAAVHTEYKMPKESALETQVDLEGNPQPGQQARHPYQGESRLLPSLIEPLSISDVSRFNTERSNLCLRPLTTDQHQTGSKQRKIPLSDESLMVMDAKHQKSTRLTQNFHAPLDENGTSRFSQRPGTSSSPGRTSNSKSENSDRRRSTEKGKGRLGDRRTSLSDNVEVDEEEEDEEEGEEDEEEGEEDDENNKKGKSGRPSPRIACPFGKYDPETYCENETYGKKYRLCATTGFDSISRLKEHLRRAHVPSQCENCWKVMPSKKALKKHIQDGVVCEKRKPQRQGISEDQMNQIGERGIPWEAIYKILFPDAPVPRSPYYDVVPQPVSTAHWQPLTLLELADFEAHQASEFARLFEASLRNSNVVETMNIGDASRASLVESARSCLTIVFTNYRRLQEQLNNSMFSSKPTATSTVGTTTDRGYDSRYSSTAESGDYAASSDSTSGSIEQQHGTFCQRCVTLAAENTLTDYNSLI